MSIDWNAFWHEMGIIAAIYAGAVVVYSVVLLMLYNQAPEADIQALLKDIPSFLQEEKGLGVKIGIVKLLAAVVLYTLPLTISIGLLSYNFYAGSLSLPGILASILIPFGVYYFIFDRSVLTSQFHEIPAGWVAWMTGSVGILFYYVTQFKIMTVGSALVGGWAGYKLHKTVG